MLTRLLLQGPLRTMLGSILVDDNYSMFFKNDISHAIQIFAPVFPDSSYDPARMFLFRGFFSGGGC